MRRRFLLGCLLILLSLSQIVLARRQRSSSIDETTPPRQRAGGGIGAHNPNDPKKRRRKRRRPKLPRETRKLIKTKTKEAIRLAKQNHLRGAAKIFEEIVELSPKDAQYLNNLAVTYMRMKLYHLAEQMLRRARRANPEDPDPIANLKELRDYLPDTLPFDAPSQSKTSQLHHTVKFTRIPYKDFHLPKYEKYRRGRFPYVLTGAIDHWRNAFEHWSLKYFMDKYPNIDVEHYSRSMVQESVKPVFTKIEYAYADMTAQSKWYKDKPGVYVQWNLNTQHWNDILSDATKDVENGGQVNERRLPTVFGTDDVWFEKCFENNRNHIDGFLIGTHWRMVLIGSEHAGMFNHRDILRSASFQAQLVGSKRWHLCGPSQDEHMYTAGDIDTFRPDYEKFPKTKQAHCIDDWVVPGEMIFYGRNWWHHTETLPDPVDGRPCVSITGTLTDENNYDGMVQELSRECGLELPDGSSTSKLSKRIHLPEGTCKNLPKCFRQWEQDWGTVEKDLDLQEERDFVNTLVGGEGGQEADWKEEEEEEEGGWGEPEVDGGATWGDEEEEGDDDEWEEM